MGNVCVIGSINMDLMVKVDRMVKVGETIISKGYYKNSGGKGANQAVAASRLGANVYMIGKVGNDETGDVLLRKLSEDNVDVKYISIDEENPTGMAVITVDGAANNSIIVIPGANRILDCSNVQRAEEISKMSELIVAQFETAVKATVSAFKTTREKYYCTLF